MVRFVAVAIALLIARVPAFKPCVHRVLSLRSSSSLLMAKKGKGKGGYSPPGRKGQVEQESKAKQEQRFDAATRQFMFTMTKVSKKAPSGKDILKDVYLSFYPGAKIGVVGLNGSGKSTLLRIMSGEDTEIEGTAKPLPGASIGFLKQEPELEGLTVGDAIEPALVKARASLEAFNELSVKLGEDLSDDEMAQVMDELETVQADIDANDLWDLDRRVTRAMEALRCPPNDAELSVLSGGERRRVALAKLLLENHDLLLLDEPTNHLDAESVSWLEQFLAQFKGTVVAVTHDRYFLNNVAGWILELDRGKGLPHEGNYESWLAAKAERLDQESKSDSRLKRTLATELEWVSASPKARQAKSKARLKQYDQLAATQPTSAELMATSQIFIPPGPRLGEVVVTATNLKKQFGERVLFDDLNFELPRSGIVGVIGANGAGKSTLMKMLNKQFEPDGGALTIGETVKMVTVDQMRSELNGEKTVFEEITGGQDTLDLGSAQVNSRAYVSWFGFVSGDQQKKVGVLSGGERNRVQLAKLLRTGGNVMVLDEPTNDLDVDTLRSLEEALLNFAGCVIVVSHDRYFLDRIATHIMAFEGDSKVTFFQGNYQDYAKDRSERLGGEGNQPKPIKFAKVV